jgi:PTH1 family peptidyl-tRNA hydrolase
MSQVIVGLGNPGPEYRDTRHNVGHRVLDLLAARLHKAWRREGGGLIAHAQWRHEPIDLVKPQSFMNVSGPVVAAALRRTGATAAELILVYDDIDMELGKVRVRMRGRAGGHNGVRSIIASLGTEDIQRVKVGIGRPAQTHDVADHVLMTFEPDELPAVEQAVETAADRVLELVGRAR